MPLVFGAALEAFFAFMSRLVISRIGQWILTAMIFLGIKFTSQKLVVEPLISQIQSSVSGLGSYIVGWIAYLNVDIAITIILSAYASGYGTRAVMSHIGKSSS